MGKFTNQTVKRTLLATNILTIAVLTVVVVKENYPSRIYNKFFNNSVTQKTKETDCQYPLKYYDFHYRKETNTPSVIMLGNSLIRHGKWDSLLNRKDVINRGISGDNLKCICERLAYLKNSTAKIIFVEGGINDIPGNNVDTLYNYYKQIVNFWQTKNKIPVINLVLYISPKAGVKFPSRTDYKLINTTVKNLNDKLRSFAIDNKIEFIDLNPLLSNEQSLQLEDKYTTDGVHLTTEAYKIWSEEIENVLNRHSI